MPVHTVLGPIEPQQLGRTSMHEHLLSDLRLWAKPPLEPPPPGPIGPAMMGYLRWNALSVPENLVLHDASVAAAELADAKAAGASAVLELTLPGMGRRLEDLPEISRRSGVHICVGAGWYVEKSMPHDVRTADLDILTAALISDLSDGIGESRIKPALIGEVGTNYPVTDAEWRNVRAAARAGVATGAAVSVHLSFREQAGLKVLDVLLEEGMDPSRVIVGHLDENYDPAYHLEIAARGAVLAYDTFGSDFYYGSPELRNPTDAERLQMVAMLIEKGCAGQLVIAADVWTQANLKHNGGYGYEHLFRRIMPAIERLGGAELLHQIAVENPRRLLNRP